MIATIEDGAPDLSTVAEIRSGRESFENSARSGRPANVTPE